MSIKTELLEEPKLQFGSYFEHEDCKTGLAAYGQFGKSVAGLHPSEIKLGFIGTGETVSDGKEWIEECAQPIESENVKRSSSRSDSTDTLPGVDMADPQGDQLEKILDRDFVGFSRESPFACCFQTNERWDRVINHREVQRILDVPNKEQRIWQLVVRFEEELKSLATTSPSPDIVIVALTPAMVDLAHAVKLSDSSWLNFRRAIKACAMKWGVPIQLLKHRTVTGQGADLQDKATRAWNFCTAQYYKKEGVPWRPITLQPKTCYVGVSFYTAGDEDANVTVRSSVAQAFDYLGQGLVLRGDPFVWDKEQFGRSPHLTKAAARKLVQDVLKEYVRVIHTPPSRIVVHKTSKFWGAEHGDYNELEGLYEGIDSVFAGCESDLLALKQTGVYLFREGRYPPVRGTYFCVEGQGHFLYTMGFVPYLQTYPGSYVPEPWQIIDHHGGSSPKDLFREVLALTKMNVNNCSFADGSPITLSFSRKIGEIMKHVPVGETVQPKLKFYM